MQRKKGISLIVLVITIIVMIILAAAIVVSLNNNNIVGKAKEARILNERAKILEVAVITKLDSMIENEGKISEETVLTKTFAELSKEGYEIKTVASAGQELKGILIQDTTGNGVTEVNLQQGKSSTIKVNLDLQQEGSQKHYILIEGKYYEISIVNGEIVLAENAEDDLSGNEYTIKLTPTGEGIKLIVGETEITRETTIVDGAEIEIIAGETAGNYGLNVKVENTSYTKDVAVKVVANPLYATDLSINAAGNATEVESGEELQMEATMIPDTATDTVEWRVVSGSATIDNTGLLKINSDAQGETSIIVGAKCIRSDGTTSPVEEKTITLTVVDNEVPVTGVSLDKTSEEIYEKTKIQLTATIEPSDATNKNVTWSSDDESVATVDSNGLVIGISEGTANITVTTEDGGKTAIYSVTVKIPPLTSTVTSTNHTGTVTRDTLGNRVYIPGGFKIAEDSGSTVKEGIVVEDDEGNQFVWIPVSNINHDGSNKIKVDENTEVEITLGRYIFNNTTGAVSTTEGEYQYACDYSKVVTLKNYYKEYATGYNANSNDLAGFVNSVEENYGYYLARYEASTGDDGLIKSKEGTVSIDSGSRDSASTSCRNMYSENEYVKSNLTNSYAWDTAVIYIQAMGNENYANKRTSDEDEVCKIFDMAGNKLEWTTEYSSYTRLSGSTTFNNKYTFRGGYPNAYGTSYGTADRGNSSGTDSRVGFRPILY